MSAPRAAELAPLAAACNAYWQAWSARDADALLDLWDLQDGAATYVPADASDRVLGGLAVGDYLRQRAQAFEVIQMRPALLKPRRLAADLGAAFAVVDWAHRRRAEARLVGGTIRVAAVLRKRDSSWRLCHYAEAPVAPLVELRQFYQRIAADGHEALS